jgi:hypothetical protein
VLVAVTLVLTVLYVVLVFVWIIETEGGKGQ